MTRCPPCPQWLPHQRNATYPCPLSLTTIPYSTTKTGASASNMPPMYPIHSSKSSLHPFTASACTTKNWELENATSPGATIPITHTNLPPAILIPSCRSTHSAPLLHWHLPAPSSPGAPPFPVQRPNRSMLSSLTCSDPQRARRFWTWAKALLSPS